MGGGDDPYANMDIDQLNKNLMKHSSLYKILNNYFGVYIGVIVVLIASLGYFAYFQYQFQGIPGAGQDSAMPWDSEGAKFLTTFFTMSRAKYGIGKNPGYPQSVIDEFESKADEMVIKMKGPVDSFCNIVAPCNICQCRGPDPNYGGDPKSAPLVPYLGMNKITGKSCKPPAVVESYDPLLEHMTSQTSPGQAILDAKEKTGISEKFIARIPSCCCHVFTTYGIDTSIPSNVAALKAIIGYGTSSPTGLTNISQIISIMNPDLPDANRTLITAMKTAPGTTADSIYPLGLIPEAGCEPMGRTVATVKTKDGNTPSHINYALDMFMACLNPNPTKSSGQKVADPATGDATVAPIPESNTLPNEGKTPFDINMRRCANYDIDLDRGISLNNAQRYQAIIPKFVRVGSLSGSLSGSIPAGNNFSVAQSSGGGIGGGMQAVGGGGIPQAAPGFGVSAQANGGMQAVRDDGSVAQSIMQAGTPSNVVPLATTIANDLKDQKDNGTINSWTDGVWNSTGAPSPVLDTSLPLTWTDDGGPNWPCSLPIMQTGYIAPNGIGVTEPHAAFNTRNMETSYYYKLNNITYKLKIDNHLHEVFAYPLKDINKSKFSTTQILESDPGGSRAVAFLNFGLTGKINPTATDPLVETDMMHVGSYVFPSHAITNSPS